MARPILLGIAAMDRKARSKPMQSILNRLLANKELNVQIITFGDKVLADEPPTAWPIVDVLISFFSTGFPLDKAIAYADLRKPVLINDLCLQKVLWDRRLVLAILDAVGVPTPFRIEASRDGGPYNNLEPRVATHLQSTIGIPVDKRRNLPVEVAQLKEGDEDVLVVGTGVHRREIRKPFLEKPVSGEDHNIHIYFAKAQGGGGRRLFRKVGNKSSEFDPELTHPRQDGSFIYEEFMDVDNAEDIKVYTIGSKFVHAETRKSPVVDGLVKRNPEGKEIRYITELTASEKQMATTISRAFKQNVCGFDMLRVGKKSYVIDVNGWSFVKGNDYYYDRAAEIMSKFLRITSSKGPHIRAAAAIAAGLTIDASSVGPDLTAATPSEQAGWKLRSNVTVFRHGDRTPKQKLKRSFKVADSWTAPLIRLLQNRREEIILRSNLNIVYDAAFEAASLPRANQDDLKMIMDVIHRKQDAPGTKIQMKPGFNKETDALEKMTLVIKWGGEFSHAARHQAKEYGLNMRRDLLLMNPAMLRNCTVYTSSERRVTASAETFTAALLGEGTPSGKPSYSPSPLGSGALYNASNGDAANAPSAEPIHMIVRKDLLDDSNAAKDRMDKVKKRLKKSLRPDQPIPDDWPDELPPPGELGVQLVELLQHLRKTMAVNYERLDVDSLQHRWCTHETPALFRERWEKLFSDYEDDPHDPSRISELYDMLTHDGLHNRAFLEKIFADPEAQTTPSSSEEDPASESLSSKVSRLGRQLTGASSGPAPKKEGKATAETKKTKEALQGPLRALFKLYHMALLLFNYVCPREYGMTFMEKEQIGLLTSMPLLNNIISDFRGAEGAESQGMASLYFTKESHIHTLLNLICTSDLPIVMPRPPPLDYFSSITFEVYERVPNLTVPSKPSGASPVPVPLNEQGVHGRSAPPSGGNSLTHELARASAPFLSSSNDETSTSPPVSAPHLGHNRGASVTSLLGARSTSSTPGIGSNASTRSTEKRPERSMIITVSEGAHSDNILSINLDARHALAPLPRRPLTKHMDYDEAIAKLAAHTLRVDDVGPTDRGQIEGDTVYFGGEEQDAHLLYVRIQQQKRNRRNSNDTQTTDRTDRSEALTPPTSSPNHFPPSMSP